MNKGLFVTLEGGEGAGKSTQIRKLATILREQGREVVETREPGGPPAAEALRKVFIDHKGQDWPVAAQVLLMLSARALHVNALIKPALAAGKIVICDRFTDSTLVYQGVQGMDPDVIKRIQADAIGAFGPDLTFILDIDPQTALARTGGRKGKGDTFEKKALDFHERMRQGFLEIARSEPGRCVIVDARQDIEAVAAAIREKVLERL